LSNEKRMFMKLNKCRAAITAIGLGLGLAAGPVSAAITYFSPVTTFEDDNIDYVQDNNGNGLVDVGDRLISVLEFNQTTGINAGQGPNPVGPGLELTGVADMTVVAITAGVGVLVLAPSNTAPAMAVNGGQAGLLAGFAPGTAVALWTDATPDLNVINATCGTRAACASLAGLGGADGSSLYMTAGFFGDPDAAWVSNPLAGGSIIAVVEGGGAATPFANFAYSLQVGVNNTGQTFGTQSCVPFCGIGGDSLIEVVGSGSVLGGVGLNHAEWTGRSDNDASVVPVSVPEPGSLALLGLGLAGLGFGASRGKKLASK
jgi:hypothetical protein